MVRDVLYQRIKIFQLEEVVTFEWRLVLLKSIPLLLELVVQLYVNFLLNVTRHGAILVLP